MDSTLSRDLHAAFPGSRYAPPGRAQMRGVHHLVFNTDDLRVTLDFYVRVLGMPLVHALTTPAKAQGSPSLRHGRGAPPYSEIPHVFLDMGGDSLMAFFQYPKDTPRADRDTIGAMQHVSLACGPARFNEILARLRSNGIDITAGPKVTIPPACESVYFFDPHGVRLEICANMAGDETDLRVIDTVQMTAGEMRLELAKVSDDDQWIDEIISSMSVAGN